MIAAHANIDVLFIKKEDKFYLTGSGIVRENLYSVTCGNPVSYLGKESRG